MFVIEAEYEYSDTVKNGVIIEQSVAADELVQENQPVQIKVSKGGRYPSVPSFSGMKKDSYLSVLNDLGIAYTVQTQTDEELSANTVIAVSPQPGSVIDREAGTEVTVTVSVK